MTLSAARSLRAVALLLITALAWLPMGTARAGLGLPAAPFAVMSVSPPGGVAPVQVSFDSAGTLCLEGCTIASYSWDFGDGSTGSGPVATHTYTRSGLFTARLTVTATNGATASASQVVNVFEYTTGKIVATPDRGLIPLPVTFDGTGSRTNWDRTIVSYAWDFGDGATGSGPIVSHTYTRPGVYQASLRVTDNLGGFQVVGTTVFAQDPLLAPANVTATSPVKGAVKLTWTNRMVAVDRITVERCAGATCTNFVQVFSLPGTQTTWTDQGLRSGATYRYRIRVFDYLGRSAATSPVKIKVR